MTNDNINHPSHYTSHPSKVECCEIVRHLHGARSHAYKYVFRRKLKNTEVENLKKALWWLVDAIDNPTEQPYIDHNIKAKIQLVADYEPEPFGPLLNIIAWGEVDELKIAAVALQSIIDGMKS